MSQENVEIVGEQLAAIERGGLEAVAEFWHPEIEWLGVPSAPAVPGRLDVVR